MQASDLAAKKDRGLTLEVKRLRLPKAALEILGPYDELEEPRPNEILRSKGRYGPTLTIWNPCGVPSCLGAWEPV
jgi:hypothetical protein